MSEYTPTTDDVRRSYRAPAESVELTGPRREGETFSDYLGRVAGVDAFIHRQASYAAFDRWLAAHDAEVAAKALGDALEAAARERDAAVAAIERVRKYADERSVYAKTRNNTVGSWRIASDLYDILNVPIEEQAALDGAPEPDREAQLERVATRLREIVYLCGDDLGCQCEEAQDASLALARELSIIAADRPTLTADEVWAIAKAEHDYTGDTDNVPAFVDSLVDSLRAAGVPFDEQPFIDSGYLLPVEGESNGA